MIGKAIYSPKTLCLSTFVTIVWTLFVIQSDLFITKLSCTKGKCLEEFGARSTEDKRITKDERFIPIRDGLYQRHVYIYLWNTFAINRSVTCGSQVECHLTSNKSSMLHSSAIIFDVQHLSSYDDIPKDKTLSQVWILMSLQPPLEFRRNLSFFNGLINWTSTYSDDIQVSDVTIRYGTYEVRSTVSDNRGSLLSTVYHPLSNKRRMVAWFVSECRLPAAQIKVVKILQQNIPVDVYGTCRSLDCGNKDHCLEILSKHYKFYLAFEKVNCRHYITDQFWYVALQHDVIPVVMGVPRKDYEKVAPPHSFIHVDDFRSVAELAKYLNKLSDDLSLYKSYFKWKENGFVSLLKPWPHLSDVYWCDLCSALNNKFKIGKIRFDIDEWWSYGNQCGIS